MKRFFALIVTISALASPAVAQKAGNGNFANAAKKVVADQFKDPDSVRFRDMAVYQKYNSESKYLCGEVNAKNGYGAYVGYKSFYADTSSAKVIVDETDRLDWIYYRENCHKKLAPIK